VKKSFSSHQKGPKKVKLFSFNLNRRIHEFEAKYRAEQANNHNEPGKSCDQTVKNNGQQATSNVSSSAKSSFASSITEMAGKASWYFPSGTNIKEMSKSTSNKAASKLFQLFHHKSNSKK
jgi:hypothetical protein